MVDTPKQNVVTPSKREMVHARIQLVCLLPMLVMALIICPLVSYRGLMVGHAASYYQDKSFIELIAWTIFGVTPFGGAVGAIWACLMAPIYLVFVRRREGQFRIPKERIDVVKTIACVMALLSSFPAALFFRWTMMSGL